MTSRQFELAMADVFRRWGYEVTVTPDGPDGGIDLIMVAPGERILVQCKHWHVFKVGVKVVRELYGVMAAQGATGGIVVTSGRFTGEAKSFARSVNVQLLDGRDVALLLGSPLPQQASQPGVPRCPRCGEHMVVRTSQRGTNVGERFWGCPRFPSCRGVIPLGPPTNMHPSPTVNWVPDSGAVSPRGALLRAMPARRRRRGSLAARLALVVIAALVVPLVGVAALVGAITRPAQRIAPSPATKPTVTAPAAPADARIVATIPLTAQPHQLAVNSDLNRLYVTHAEAKSLTVVDLTTRAVVSTVPLDLQPGAIAFDAKTQTLWVTNYNDASVSVLSLTGSSKATVKVGQGPVGIAVDPGMGKVFVTNSLDSTVSVIDTSTRRVVTTKKLPWRLGAAVMDPVKHHLCTVNPMAMNMWYCYDSSLIFTAVLSPSGESIAIDSSTHTRYATRSTTKSLEVVDGISGKSTSIPLGHTITSVAVDPNTHLAYVAAHDTRKILVIKPQ